MLRPEHITALTAFVIMVTFLAFSAYAFEQGFTVDDRRGDYVQPFHCEDNPKIEGCSPDDPTALPAPPFDNTLLTICCSIIAAMFSGAIWLTWVENDPKELRKRLFALFLWVGGGMLTVVLFVLK